MANERAAWLWAIPGMILIVPAAQFIGRTLAELQNENDRANPKVLSMSPSVEVAVSRQASEGFTEDDLDQAFLKKFEDWSVERIAALSKKHWDAANVPENMRVIRAESLFFERWGHKLGVTRIKIGADNPTAIIIGILDREIVRVTCTTRDGSRIAITSGPCSDKLDEIFGNRAIAKATNPPSQPSKLGDADATLNDSQIRARMVGSWSDVESQCRTDDYEVFAADGRYAGGSEEEGSWTIGNARLETTVDRERKELPDGTFRWTELPKPKTTSRMLKIDGPLRASIWWKNQRIRVMKCDDGSYHSWSDS